MIYENDRIRRLSALIARLWPPAWHQGIRVRMWRHMWVVRGGVHFAALPFYVLHRSKDAANPKPSWIHEGNKLDTGRTNICGLWASGNTFLLLVYHTTSSMICTVVWTCNKTAFRACLETMMARKQCETTKQQQSSWGKHDARTT